jgi:ATP-dependent RNA helicase RhlB
LELKSLAKSLANKIMRRVSGQQELVAAQSVLDEATTVDRVVEVEEGQLPSKKPSKPKKRRKKPQWTPENYPVEPCEGKTRFYDFSLPNGVLHALADNEFAFCTPIQAGILPHTLSGDDMIGQAQTGTGKTAAFLVSIISRLLRHKPHELKKSDQKRAVGVPRALVIAPTRELVIQIEKDAKSLIKYTPLNVQSVFGGMDYQKQRDRLRNRPVDILIATPGRLLDFQQKKEIRLDSVEVLVLDEADRMLDMGFIPDVRRIVQSTPDKKQRQTLFFGATFTTDVKRLASQWTKGAKEVAIEVEQVTAKSVEQVVYLVTQEEKFLVLLNLIKQQDLNCLMIFANQRYEARDLSVKLNKHGIHCAFLSGEVDQKKRVSVLEGFRSGKIKVLVATDVIGRGIHVDGVTHVVNYTLPQDPEDYVHRIGRTGRAGSKGTAISFASEFDAFQLPAIETYIEQPLPCVYPEEKLLEKY